MRRVVTVGRIKDLNDAVKAIDQLVAAVNQLADENEKLKARLDATEPAST